MGPEARELMAFLKAIQDNPRDTDTRKVFADWLEEHDEPEEATRQREQSTKEYLERFDAEAYVRGFCEKYEADYDDCLNLYLKVRGTILGRPAVRGRCEKTIESGSVLPFSQTSAKKV